MPYLMTRQQALSRVTEERGAGCLICELVERAEAAPIRLLHRDRVVTVVLSRYPRQWGHVLVLLNRHCTNFTELDAREWQSVSVHSLHAARAIESSLRPSRCYVASLGSARMDLPMTSPHLHVHAVPIYDPDDKPTSIFSWERGVYDAPESEWHQLHAILSDAWRA